MNERSTHDGHTNNTDFICGVVEGFYGRPWSCEQRKDLFSTLKELRLNSYMYGPKDDLKHRAKWRQLYSEQEAEELRSLISNSKANGIDFYYSLAPGLDMIFSDPEELNLLRTKYDQLVELGCESFAILFDDIEPGLNERDKDAFKNYANAQLSVANMIYEHLKRPKFLFCPTEYCESRAIPNVPNSIYLNTIGSGLLPGIDIMWCGPRVVSRLITEESIENLTKTIKRPPVIWENLHANDYDKKRVYLGPYSGRSTKLIPKLKGVMTNPNCEFEANYIAIHTLAQWSRCNVDMALHNQCNFGIQLVQKGQEAYKSVYDPHQALEHAIKDWLPHLLKSKTMPTGIDLIMQTNRPSDEIAANQLSKEASSSCKGNEENVVDMSPDGTPSSSTSAGTGKSVMDTSSPVVATDTNSCDSCEMQVVCDQGLASESNDKIINSQPNNLDTQSNVPCVDFEMSTGDKSENLAPASQTAKSSPAGDSYTRVNFNNISLLVDLFYLPFEHGLYGNALLNDTKWLRDNHGLLLNSEEEEKGTKLKYDEKSEEGTNSADTGGGLPFSSWLARAEKLNDLCVCISDLVNNLIHNCPNKVLVLELYPYLADMREVSAKIISYIKFLRYRAPNVYQPPNALPIKTALASQPVAPSSMPAKESAICEEELEPWVHRGGLWGDMQRLLS